MVLEDLAATFHLKTQETIDRVNRLEKSGRITGVVDDRGKFIYIEPQEMEKVRWQLAWARFRGSCRNVAPSHMSSSFLCRVWAQCLLEWGGRRGG